MSSSDKEPEVQHATPAQPTQDQLVVTKHVLTLGGQEIAYTATCGTIVLKEETLKKGEKEGEAEGEKPTRGDLLHCLYTR